jgi:hypothetical protein
MMRNEQDILGLFSYGFSPAADTLRDLRWDLDGGTDEDAALSRFATSFSDAVRGEIQIILDPDLKTDTVAYVTEAVKSYKFDELLEKLTMNGL